MSPTGNSQLPVGDIKSLPVGNIDLCHQLAIEKIASW